MEPAVMPSGRCLVIDGQPERHHLAAGLVCTGGELQRHRLVLFDRDVATEEESALACYAALKRELEADGYWPYRSATLGMPTAHSGVAADGLSDLLQTVKAAVDPRDILAPRRYITPRAPRRTTLKRVRS